MKLETKQIGTVTVVYVAEDEYGDKSGWITQSYPTNFHSFWQEKSLVKGDSVDNYKWVSDTEKATIEANDAKWEEPSEEFVKQWENHKTSTNGVMYNRNTGYFEANGLVDLTEKQAKVVVYCLITYPWVTSFDYAMVRTTLYANRGPLNSHDRSPTLFSLFRNCTDLEVALLADDVYGVRPSSTSVDIISGCPKLKKVIGKIVCTNLTAGCSVVRTCPELEDITLNKVSKNITCSAPKLNFASMSYMVTNSANGSTAITIKIHLDTYCKLLSSLSEEEATTLFANDATSLARWKEIKATLTEQERADWGTVYTTARNKNINFATT